MKFEDFDTEWRKAFLGNPPYVAIELENNSVIWTNYHKFLGNDNIKFFRKTLDEYGTYLMSIARTELKNIVRVYNPWSD